MRIPVRKRYERMIMLVALANGERAPGEPEGITDAVMPFGHEGFADYGPKEKFASQVRDTLRRLAIAETPAQGAVTTSIMLPDLPPVGVSVDFTGRIWRTMDFYRDQLLPALQDLDKQRLKICPICDKLFVALRTDQPTCSAACGNTHRARQFRQKAKQYESNRKENLRRKAQRESLRRQTK